MINSVKGLYWQKDAVCLREDPDLFYSRGTNGTAKMPAAQVQAAKAVCHGCPVRAECLDWALEHGEIEHGVWGARTPHERRGEQRRRRFDPVECV